MSLAAAAGTVLLAQAFHPLMLIPLRAGQNAAWLSSLITVLFSVLFYLPAAYWLSRRQSGDLIDLAEAAAGVPGAIATALLSVWVLVHHSGLILRMTSEMAVTSSYPHTPQTFVQVGLLACVWGGAYIPLTGLVRLCRLFLPPLAGGILCLLVGGLGWGEMRFLLPFWGPGPLPLLLRSLGNMSFHTPTILFLLLAVGGTHQRRRIPLAGTGTIILVTLLLSLVSAVLAITFPPPLGYNVTYPLHDMARLMVGGRFFERLEVIWLFLWVMTTAAHLSALVHVAAAAFARAFRMDDHRSTLLPLLTLVAVVAMFPSDQADAIEWGQSYMAGGNFASAALPVILTGLALVRGRRQRNAFGGR